MKTAQRVLPIDLTRIDSELNSLELFVSKIIRIAAALTMTCSPLAGCMTASPKVYEGLASAGQLQPNPQDKSGRIPYKYHSTKNWQQYSKIIVDPVTVYNGRDSQFKDVTPKEKETLSRYMEKEFTQKLSQRFAIVNAPGPDTLRLHLTMTGAKITTPLLGPVSRLDMAGGVYNTIQAVRGQEGSMSGSISYAVEIYDAKTNRLLYAYVAKQYPNAMNVGATFSSLEASKVGIRKGADELLAEFK